MAKCLGITKYEAVMTWHAHCRFLQAKSRKLRKAIYDACQLSPEAAARRSGMTKHEVLRIHWHWKRELKREQKGLEAHALQRSFSLAESKSQFKIYAVSPPWTGSIDTDIADYMKMAIEDVSEYEEDQWPQERLPNEFTSFEFTDGKGRSQYGWVYLTLHSMGSDEVDRCFGPTGRQFMDICRLTLRNRIQRKRDYLSGQNTPGSATRRSRKRRSKSDLLPSPSIALSRSRRSSKGIQPAYPAFDDLAPNAEVPAGIGCVSASCHVDIVSVKDRSRKALAIVYAVNGYANRIIARSGSAGKISTCITSTTESERKLSTE